MAPAQQNIEMCNELIEEQIKHRLIGAKENDFETDCENNNIVSDSVCEKVASDEGFDIIKYEKMDFKAEIRWPDLIAQVFLHSTSIYALYLIVSLEVKLFTILFVFATIYTSGFGITAGVHRLWSHRAYRARLPLRILLAMLFTITGQNYSKNILSSDDLIEQPKSYGYLDKQESAIITQEAMPKVVTIPAVSEEPQSPIILQQIEDSRVTNYVIPKIDEISEDLKTVTASLNTISENQQVLFGIQNNILSKLSEMQTQFEEIAIQLFKPKEKTQSLDIKPINSLKEFQEFENLLSANDPEVISELKNKLLVACSKGKGKGYNNAYILIDVLFERNFLTDCSWAGGSKSEKVKICFKSFTNTIKLFFNTIHESDGDFTLVDCHKFLKIILRNSLQRCNNKQLRLSSKKNRQKKTKNIPQSQPLETAQLDQPQPESMVIPGITNTESN